MGFSASDWSWEKPVSRFGWSRPLSAWAGFFGAIPFGLGGLMIVLAASTTREIDMDVRGVFVGLLSLLPLMPFVIACTWIKWHEWPRVQVFLFAGLVVGMMSILLFWFIGLVLVPAVVLGLIFGLVALLPCWWRGDAAGQAMSLLGLAPATLFFLLVILQDNFRWLRVHIDDPAPPCPWLTSRQVLYVIILVFILSYALTLYWAFLRQFAWTRHGVKTIRNYAPSALAGGIAGGLVAVFLMGMIGLVVALLTDVSLFGTTISGGTAGAIFGAIGSTGAKATRRFPFVARKVEAIMVCLIVGMVQYLTWIWWGDSFIVLVGGLSGLYGGISVGNRLLSRKSIDGTIASRYGSCLA